MPQSCKICNNSRRLEIDRELVTGKSKSKIAQKYDVPYHSVDYHARHHLSRQMLQGYERKGRLVSDELVSQFEDLFVKAKEMHDRSLARDSVSGDALALRALSEQRAILDTMCRILALMVEAKAMEQQKERLRRIEDVDLSGFTRQELKVLANLGYIMDGKEPPYPDFRHVNINFDEPKVRRHSQESIQDERGTAKAALETANQIETSNNPPEVLDPESNNPQGILPPATVKIIPGGESGNIRVHRQRLARKAYSRQVEENRSPTGIWFPDGKE